MEVDESWWNEDGHYRGGFHAISLDRAQTNYIVLIREHEGEGFFTCPKMKEAYMHSPGAGEKLSDGTWSVTIAITAEGVRIQRFFDLTIDGVNVTWTERPWVDATRIGPNG